MSTVQAAPQPAPLQLYVRRLDDLAATHQAPSDGLLGLTSPLLDCLEDARLSASGANDHALHLLMKTSEAAVIRTLLSLGVIEAIPPSGSSSLSNLAAVTGAQAELLDRLLRSVVGSGFIRLTDNEEYAHSHMSLGYLGSTGKSFAGCFDECLQSLVALPQYLAAKGKVEPASFTHNPITWLAGQEGTTAFEIIASDPGRLANMHHMMVAVEHLRPYTGFYDYAKLATDDSERMVFVDIGGGIGHVIEKVLEATKAIQPGQCVLQDRREVIDLAESNAALSSVRLQAHDYFSPQPVKGAKAYHLRAVAHDLSDMDFLRALEQIVPAMADDSKILIADQIIPKEGGSAMTSFMDLMMMCMGGKERTAKDFARVLDQAGLQLDAIYQADDLQFGIVEASLKKPWLM